MMMMEVLRGWCVMGMMRRGDFERRGWHGGVFEGEGMVF